MRISISPDEMTEFGLFLPDDLIPPVDVNDLFELEVFKVSRKRFVPFDEIEVEWSIKPMNANIAFNDYIFSLAITERILEGKIAASGTLKFSAVKNTLLRIRAQRKGHKGWSLLGEGIPLSVDEDMCLVSGVLAQTFDDRIFDKFSSIISETADIRLRTIVAEKGIGPLKEFETVTLEPTATWEEDSIKYYFPLELDVKGIFTGALDIHLEIAFAVTHDKGYPELNVMVNHSSSVDFRGFDDFISFGNTATVAKTAERLLPLLLDCESRNLESQIARLILEIVESRIATHRLLDVRIVPLDGFTHIAVVLCPRPRVIDPDIDVRP